MELSVETHQHEKQNHNFYLSFRFANMRHQSQAIPVVDILREDRKAVNVNLIEETRVLTTVQVQTQATAYPLHKRCLSCNLVHFVGVEGNLSR